MIDDLPWRAKGQNVKPKCWAQVCRWQFPVDSMCIYTAPRTRNAAKTNHPFGTSLSWRLYCAVLYAMLSTPTGPVAQNSSFILRKAYAISYESEQHVVNTDVRQFAVGHRAPWLRPALYGFVPISVLAPALGVVLLVVAKTRYSHCACHSCSHDCPRGQVCRRY